MLGFPKPGVPFGSTPGKDEAVWVEVSWVAVKEFNPIYYNGYILQIRGFPQSK